MPLREIFKATEPSDVEAAQRRLAIAQALQQRAMQPSVPASGGPVQAAYSPGNALVDLASALASAWGVKRAEAAYDRAKTAKQQASTDSLKKFAGSSSYEESIPLAQEAINQGINPQLVAALLEQRAPKPEESYTLAPGQTRFKGGIEVASVPAMADKDDSFTLGPGQRRYKDGKLVAEAPAPSDKPKSKYRALTAQEIAQIGLPAGTSAQIDDETGKIDVLSKRDTTASLSQKDQTTAKIKLNTVAMARQQLNDIRARFEKLKGAYSAGPFGLGRLPTEEGQSFDRSVDQMRSTLTSLTRVPGVGAMSDYETKLDQAKFPSRNAYESVTQQQIDGLDSMLNAIESGYRDLLGQSAAPSAPAQPAAPAKEITATGPNGEKIVLKNGQWVPLGR